MRGDHPVVDAASRIVNASMVGRSLANPDTLVSRFAAPAPLELLTRGRDAALAFGTLRVVDRLLGEPAGLRRTGELRERLHERHAEGIPERAEPCLIHSH